MISEKGLQATLANVFRKQEDPKELVRKWQRSIRGEIRGVERQMMGGWAAGAHARPLQSVRGGLHVSAAAATRRCQPLPPPLLAPLHRLLQTSSASRRRRKS